MGCGRLRMGSDGPLQALQRLFDMAVLAQQVTEVAQGLEMGRFDCQDLAVGGHGVTLATVGLGPHGEGERLAAAGDWGIGAHGPSLTDRPDRNVATHTAMKATPRLSPGVLRAVTGRGLWWARDVAMPQGGVSALVRPTSDVASGMAW